MIHFPPPDPDHAAITRRPRPIRRAAVVAACAGGLLVLAAAVVPALVLGQPSTTQPAAPQQGGRGARNMPGRVAPFVRDPENAQRARFRQYMNEPPPTPDQWAAAESFLRHNSPHRFESYERLPEGDFRGPKNRTRAWLYSQFKSIAAVQDQDPQLYEWKVERMKTEDQIWYLTGMLKTAQKDQEKNEIDQVLRQAVRRLVDLGIKERKLHIDNLEQLLSLERQKLENDAEHIDAVVRDRYEQVLREGEARPHFPAKKAREKAATATGPSSDPLGAGASLP